MQAEVFCEKGRCLMARKRLNKKVALLGSVVFMVLVVAAIGLILYLNRDPQKFIADADALVVAAQKATDADTREDLFKQAETSYYKAHGLAKTDSAKIDILFKAADMYRLWGKWIKAMGCWNNVVRLDKSNVRARFSRLKYLYLSADSSGSPRAWEMVESDATELIEIAEQRGLLGEDTAQWDPFEQDGRSPAGEVLGPFLYLARGRANLARAQSGAAVDRQEALEKAVRDLEKVRELEPGNVDAYWYLAVATLSKQDILGATGSVEQRQQAAAEAEKVLEQGVEASKGSAAARINLLRLRLLGRGGEPMELLERVRSLQPEYESLIRDFPDDPAVYHAASRFFRLRPETLDLSVETAEKAVSLDSNNITYMISAANAHYSRFCISGHNEEDLARAIEIAESALNLPGAQDTPGPREMRKKRNRVSLAAFLAECYLEQILDPTGPVSQERREELLAAAEQAIREIEGVLEVGQATEVLKWRGLLELARGQRDSAVKKMYEAYEKLKSVDRKDSLLSYRLAKVFENTSEIGAVREFLESALTSTERIAGIDERKPDAILDYAQVLLRLRSYSNAAAVIDFFERKYGPNDRSRMLRTYAHIGAGQFEQAEQEIAARPADDPNTLRLKLGLAGARIRYYRGALGKQRSSQEQPLVPEETGPQGGAEEGSVGSAELLEAELHKYRLEQVELMEKLLAVDPNSVSVEEVITACNQCVADGRIERARALVQRYLEHFGDSAELQFYAKLLSEAEPNRVSAERRKQLEFEVISGISEPVRRALSLGQYYYRYNELDKAAEQFRKVFDAAGSGGAGQRIVDSDEGDQRGIAAGYLFEIALARQQWDAAERLVEAAKSENLDRCEGKFFDARLAAAKGQYDEALESINQCIQTRPIFSQGYLLRSRINSALGNDNAAVEDARQAASLNPLDGTIARALATVLYRRNRKLGRSVTSEQITETKEALLRAVRLNPRDQRLLGLYADYISDDDPQQALAIMQSLHRSAPSAENAVLLGRMAMKVGLGQTDAAKKEALLDVAGAALQEAYRAEPNNMTVLAALAQYYRSTDQPEKAVQLLEASNERRLLWAHYFETGNFAKARETLEQLYKENPSEAGVVKGLLVVARKTGDQQGVQRYSEELVAIEDSANNRLLQIQSFLQVGLIQEAERKLASFKEKFKNDARALLLEAWVAMRRGRLKEALELLNQSLQSDQDSAAAWQLRGRVNLLLGNYTQSADDLRQSKSLSDRAETRCYLARAYLRTNRTEEAITELKAAMELPGASSGEGTGGIDPRRMLEQVYLRTGRSRELRTFYERTLKDFPDSIFWHNRYGDFAFSSGDYDEAARSYGTALKIASGRDSGGAGVNRRQVSKALDGYLRALIAGAKAPGQTQAGKTERLNKVFEVGGKFSQQYLAPIAYIRMAEAKMAAGDRTAAVQYSRTAIDRAFSQQDQPFAVQVLTTAYSLLGADEVVDSCRQQLEQTPESLAANLAMFYLMNMQSQYNKAVSYIDKCIGLVGPTDARLPKLMMSKAEVLTRAFNETSDKNYLKDAIAQYESLLEKMPTNTMVLNNLAYLLARNDEDLEKALKYAEQAYSAVPNNAGVMDTYGYVLYKRGDYDRANQMLQSAFQQFADSGKAVPAEVYLHLATVKEKLGLKAEALDVCKQALELGEGQIPAPTKKLIEATIARLSEAVPSN